MNSWITHCINRPIATLVVFGAIAISGIFAAFQLPLEVLPSVRYAKLFIQTSWPGASPQSVEAYLTSLIEGELTQVRGIANIRSESREGSSRIEVELLPDYDVDYLRFAIRERISYLQEKLPEQSLPPQIIPYLPDEIESTRFLSYRVLGPYDDAFLRETALRVIRPAINTVPGVAGVDVSGGRERQIQVRFDAELLRAHRLSPSDITLALQSAGKSFAAGNLTGDGGRFQVVVRQSLQTLFDIRTLPIRQRSGRMLVLRDVATVVDTLSPAYSFQRINGNATILLHIEKEPQTNTIRVADEVYAMVAALQSRMPEGLQLLKEDDQSLAIRTNLQQLFYRALFSFLVILLVLTLFMRRLRFALLVQSVVFFSVLATLLLLFVSGYSLNIITLAGLALGFGILVDNAIVVLENIDRHEQPQPDGRQDAARVAAATSEVLLPLIASTLTTLAAILPFLFLDDELQLYYTPFAVTVSLALLVSLVISFFLLPTVAYHWILRKTAAEQPSSAGTINGRMTRRYHQSLAVILKRPVVALLLAVWLFGLPVWLLPSSLSENENESGAARIAKQSYNAVFGNALIQDNRSFIDHFFGGALHLFYRYVSRGEIWRWDSGTNVRVYASLPPGTDIRETDRIARRLEDTISGIDGIAQVRTRVSPTYFNIEVRFTAENQWSITPFLVKEKLISRAAQTGNARVSVIGYGPGFSSGGSGVTMANRLELTGYNYRQLSDFAEGLKSRLERVTRVRDVRTDQTRRFYSFDAFESIFRFDRPALAKHAVSLAGAVQQTRPYMSQYLYRQTVQLGWREVPFAVLTNNYHRFQLYEFNRLQIANSAGESLRLGDIGTAALRRTQPLIERENQNYYKILTFDYLAPYRFGKEFVDNFVTNTAVPVGFSLRQSQYNWGFQKSAKEITWVLLLALLLMYMVLAGLYESLLYPLLIFLMIPLSLVGVFLAFYLTGTTFDQAAYIGVIFLLGIVLNNGILLLDRYNQIRREQQNQPLTESIRQACVERARPILMTTFTTIAGLLPLMLLADTNNSLDIWNTLSLSTIGGLCGATLLGLLVFPALILLLEKLRYFGKRNSIVFPYRE